MLYYIIQLFLLPENWKNFSRKSFFIKSLSFKQSDQIINNYRDLEKYCHNIMQSCFAKFLKESTLCQYKLNALQKSTMQFRQIFWYHLNTLLHYQNIQDQEKKFSIQLLRKIFMEVCIFSSFLQDYIGFIQKYSSLSFSSFAKSQLKSLQLLHINSQYGFSRIS